MPLDRHHFMGMLMEGKTMDGGEVLASRGPGPRTAPFDGQPGWGAALKAARQKAGS